MSTQRSTHFLLALLLASLALSNADLYGSPAPPTAPTGPAPPPPFAVGSKTFPPESIFCNNASKTCFNKTITCPEQCPMLTPANPNEKACIIDCNSPKCEAVCGNTKPNCESSGAGCKDPRFVGGDGIVFYFRGRANEHFTLVSDPNLQINARFIGLRPAGRRHDYTWVQSLGVRFGRHTFTMAATPAASWDPHADHLAFSFDGEPLDLDIGNRASWSAPAPVGLVLQRTATLNSVTVALPGSFEIRAVVVPVTEEDDRIHKYSIPSDDCFAHLDVQFRFFGLSEKVEGVLGQTYRPNFQNPVKKGVPMPIMSGEDRYGTSSLLSTDCKRCIFSPEVPSEVESVETVLAATLDCTSKYSSNYGVVCRR